MIIHTAFDSVYGYFQNRNALFIIPSFQRPFRWGQTQVDTLIDDLIRASATNYYYLSPLHLIQINTKSGQDIALLTFGASFGVTN